MMRRADDRAASETGAQADEADGWVLRHDGLDPAREPWAETLFALGNGELGVRGVIEEVAVAGSSSLLASVFETSPIHYHERHKGFAATTDTRIPIPDGAAIAIEIDGVAIAGEAGSALSCTRKIDLRTGLLTRRTVWPSPAGPIEIVAERLVPFAAHATLVARYTITPLERPARVTLRSGLAAGRKAAGQGDDPRIGARDIDEAALVAHCDAAAGIMVQLTRRSGIRTIAAVAHDVPTQSTEALDGALIDTFEGQAAPDAPFVVTKAVVYRTHVGEGDREADTTAARADANATAATSLATLIEAQRREFGVFWGNADIAIAGDPGALLALRTNMFHVFQAASRSGRFGIAAKGLTGEGYEGHCFWDSEVFALPMLACTAPKLARAMLEYRYATLDAARANARALDHTNGALFAWRTIVGRECSAHYPSGSAQYHINAAVAFAIGFYLAATGDTGMLRDIGGEMLAETARIWLQIGHFADDRSGEFRIHGVTGPDEYTALIDNNWYTNRMAQAHLRLAADSADLLAREAPAEWAAVTARIGLTDAEIADWRRAADAMRLPFDAARDIDAQDDSFLGKPLWDIAGTPADQFPLLLHNHPMTLYRHQVAKQADLVLALVLAGEDIDRDRKQRAFDHYASVTVHDSTLSDCSFSILASEVGRSDAAMRHFREAAFVDVENRHGNSHHGAHMAAMAGSWQALVWGFGGFRAHGSTVHFAPVLPDEWESYAFTLVWRGARLRVTTDRAGTTYHQIDGPALTIDHRGTVIALSGGIEQHCPVRCP